MNVTVFEVLDMGRVGDDLYPIPTGSRPEDVATFRRWWWGSSAANVRVAAAT